MAQLLTRKTDALHLAQDLLHNYVDVFADLEETSSAHSLFKTTLRCAMDGTASSLGLIAVKESNNGAFRVECWDGFALSGPEKTTLQRQESVPTLDGDGMVEVQHVIEVPFQTAVDAREAGDSLALGRLVVARNREIPYEEHEARWLTLLARYATVILENISLQGQFGRLLKETDSVMQAGGTLITLPNLAAALEMACRKIIDSLSLKVVHVFLYGDRLSQGCHVISYPVSEPTRDVSVSLQGRGVSLLRKLLSSGAPVIANRQSECLELFEAMGWRNDFGSAACFPLDIQHHRWGALCLLAEGTSAFPPETQRNLAIFSGEVAMALENAYLRQVLSQKR
jgi:hypothetical protein